MYAFRVLTTIVITVVFFFYLEGNGGAGAPSAQAIKAAVSKDVNLLASYGLAQKLLASRGEAEPKSGSWLLESSAGVGRDTAMAKLISAVSSTGAAPDADQRRFVALMGMSFGAQAHLGSSVASDAVRSWGTGTMTDVTRSAGALLDPDMMSPSRLAMHAQMSQDLMEFIKANPLVGVTDPLVSDQLAWIVTPAGGSSQCTGTRVVKRKTKAKGKKSKTKAPCRRKAIGGRTLCDQCLVAAGLTLADQKQLQASVGQKTSRATKVSRATLGRALSKVREHVAGMLNAEHASSRSMATGATLADAIQVDSDSDDNAKADDAKTSKMSKALDASLPQLRPADLVPLGTWPTQRCDVDNLQFDLKYVSDRAAGTYGGDDMWLYNLKVSCAPTTPAANVPLVFRCLSAVTLFCPNIDTALIAPIDEPPQWVWGRKRAIPIMGAAIQLNATLRAAVRCMFSDTTAYPLLKLATSPVNTDVRVEQKLWSASDFTAPWAKSPVSTGRRGALACIVRLLGKATWAQQQLHIAHRKPQMRQSERGKELDNALYANGLLVRLLCHGVHLARSLDAIGQQDLQNQLHRLDALDFPAGAFPSNSPISDSTPLWSLPQTQLQADWPDGWDLTNSLKVVNQGDAGRALETTREVRKGERLLLVEFTALETGHRWTQLDGADTYRLKAPEAEAALVGEDLTLVMAPGSPCTLVQHPDDGPGRGSPNVHLVRGSGAFGSEDTYIITAVDLIKPGTTLTLNYGNAYHPNEGRLSVLAAAAEVTQPIQREFRDLSAAVGELSHNAANQIHANTIADNSTQFPPHLLATPLSAAAEAERTKRREGLAGTTGDLSGTLTKIQSFQALAEDLRQFAEAKGNAVLSFPTLAQVEAGTAEPNAPGRFPLDGRRAGSRPWVITPADEDVHGLRASEHKTSVNDFYYLKPVGNDGKFEWEFPERPSDVPYDEDEDYGQPILTQKSMQRGAEHTDLDPTTNERPNPSSSNLSLVDWALRTSEMPPRACPRFVRGGSDDDVLGPCIARVLHEHSRQIHKQSCSDLLGVGTPALFVTPPGASFYGSGLHMEPGHCTTRWSSQSGHSVFGAFDPPTSELVTDFHALVLGERVPKMFTDRIARCMTRSQWEALPPANALQPAVYEKLGFQPFVCSAPAGSVLFIPEQYVHWLYAFPGSERIVSGGLPPATALRNITGRQCTTPLLGRNKVDQDMDTTTFGVEDEQFSDVGAALAEVLSGHAYSAQAANDNLPQWIADASAIAGVSDTPEYQHAVQAIRHPFANRPDVCLFPNNLFVGCTREQWRAITESVSEVRKRYRSAEVQQMNLSLGKLSMHFFGFDEWERLGDVGLGDRFWLAAQASAIVSSAKKNTTATAGYAPRKFQRACVQKARSARESALSVLAALTPTTLVAGPSEAWQLAGNIIDADNKDHGWKKFIQTQRLRGVTTHDLVIRADAVATGQSLCIHDYPHDAIFEDRPTYVVVPAGWTDTIIRQDTCAGSVEGVRHVLRWGSDFFGLGPALEPAPATSHKKRTAIHEPTSNSSSSKRAKGNKNRGKRARDKDEREDDPKLDCESEDDSNTASDASRDDDSDESSS
jgi:hypothetical protein